MKPETRNSIPVPLACALLWLLAAAPLSAQNLELRARLPGGADVSYPVERVGMGLYIAVPRLSELLRALDPQAKIQWDTSTGVYRVEMAGREFSLFRQQNTLLYNKSLIDTGAHLVAASGQVFVPLVSLREILRRIEGLESNVDLLLKPEDSAGPPFRDSGPDALEGAPDAAPEVDVSAIVRDFQLDPAEPLPQSVFEKDVLAAALPLLQRRTIVIDPEIRALPPETEKGSMPRPGSAADPGADLTFRIAKRCGQILARHSTLKVVLTRENASDAPTLEERLLKVNASGAKALICLRLDRSPFTANAGYRLFTPHEAVDPEGQRHRAGLDHPERLPLEAQYLPFENVSLVLARLLDVEMTRAGLLPAKEKMKLAPYYLMKRAAMPSVSIALGYATNPGDAARFKDERYVDSAAKSLAQGLLVFDRWLEEAGLEKIE